MSVQNLVVSLKNGGFHAAGRSGVVVTTVTPEADGRSITGVIESCHGRDDPALTARGVMTELASRPGRHVTVWLARMHSLPAGVASLVAARGPEAVRHSIGWLLVSPAYRRAGVGSALVAAALAAARDRGAGEVWVETRSDWVAAVAFWRALGFSAPSRHEGPG